MVKTYPGFEDCAGFFCMTTLDLYDKPLDYQFTPEERELIRQNIKKDMEIRYVIYKGHYTKYGHIGLVIDYMRYSPRRSAAENQWIEVCRREPCEKEMEEFTTNFGCQTRRFKVYWYPTLKELEDDESMYGLQVPQEFKEAISKHKSNERP